MGAEISQHLQFTGQTFSNVERSCQLPAGDGACYY